MSKLLGTTGLTQLITLIKSAFIRKEDVEAVGAVDIDTTVTQGSSNLVTSGAVYDIVGDVETLINAL